MLNQLKRTFFIAAIVITCSCNNKPTVQIPINDFFSTPGKSAFHISPDGKYISYIKRYKGKQNIFLQTLADGKERMATSFTDYSVRDYFWTLNNQIIVPQHLFEDNAFKLFAINAATLQTHTLLSVGKNRLNFRTISRKTNNPDVITFSMNQRDSSIIDVYSLNTKTGDLKMYIKNPGNITEWFPDTNGHIRLAKSSDGVNETILYRENDEAKFRPIIVNNFKNAVEPVAFTGVKNYFYARSNVKQDKMALVEINAENVKDEKVIFSSDKADIDEVSYLKSKGRVEMVLWQEAKPQRHFLNSQIKAIYNDIAKQLPDNEIKITDRDSSGEDMLVNVSSDRNPGSVYLYKTKQKKLIKLTDVNPGVDPASLCEMKPVLFKAGDGMVINGYLTLPKGKSSNVPVVVMPHTDPWRRNNWGYSPDVQFLANRGYAVFQVNYRGSTGYGKAFFESGFKQVGGKMQQDITDGVHWLIDQKIADPKKIAMFGTGFGGFSALYGVSFHPELYNCAAVQYGLINFFTYIKDVPPFPFFKPKLAMLYEMVGNPETDAAEFKAISPVFNTDKFKCPLLIFQGGRDPHANTSELIQFVTELKKNGVAVTYVNKEGEHKEHYKHSFINRDSVKLQVYTELEKFLKVNLQGKK